VHRPQAVTRQYGILSMLSKETLERDRVMMRCERAALVADAMRENWPAMFSGSPETVARRFQLLKGAA